MMATDNASAISINNPTPKKSAVSVAAYTANSIILTMRYTAAKYRQSRVPVTVPFL